MNDTQGPQFAPAGSATRSVETTTGADVAIDLTTEIRWFFGGRLPDEVHSWFTEGGVGLTENRCDHYRLDGEFDIGVKRRSGTTLELKLRLGPAELFAIDRDLDGQLETWQRWSPADRMVFLTEHTIWIDVDKRVIKRRFFADRAEMVLSPENRAMTGAGCDVEIAAVQVNGIDAWTFAFAAFGPVDGHRDLLRTAWDVVVAERTHPKRLRLERENSCGYPQWMSKFLSLP